MKAMIIAKYTKRSPVYQRRRGQPYKTLHELDKILANRKDHQLYLDLYDTVNEAILSLAMTYVDNQNGLRRHRIPQVVTKIKAITNGTSAINQEGNTIQIGGNIIQGPEIKKRKKEWIKK